MSNLRLHLSDPQVALPPPPLKPIGRYLVDAGAITQRDLIHALELQTHIDAPLGEVLVAEGLIARRDVLVALANQHSAQLVDLEIDPPAWQIARRLPSSLCLKFAVVPWLAIGDTLLVACSQPDRFDLLRACMGPDGRKILPVVADPLQIQHQIGRLYGPELANKAATRLPSADSCRSWDTNPDIRKRRALTVVGICAIALVFAPLWTMTIAILWAFLTLVMSMILKAAALWSHLYHRSTPRAANLARDIARFRLPRVSVLVPLLHETEIASALIDRLNRLTYPKSLLDVVLVLEMDDIVTRETIARTALPDWISVIEVPEANKLKTKPRALNYALDFCKGSIIGVWDAEDAPEPDQIERIVNRFQNAPPDVACIQGVLDYYNATANWMSRCFAIEYATWWRVVLPGIARLGLVIPLGGTTLFFRRDILEKLCGWDAHNVTEDADLGIRLARRGYVTELLPTVTLEEANCRAWPWVRQRSRWLKGFLITWCVQMRQPRKLWRDLGPARFLGVQTILLATFSQFLCAPLLWSFWLAFVGLPHPIELTLGAPAMWMMIIVFVISGLLNLTLSMIAVARPTHRHLMAWSLTLPFYFPLGALAAFKGLHEFVICPFFWDKTEHGIEHP